METNKNKRRCPRRTISNDEFHRAYYGTPGDEESQQKASDNRNIIGAVLKKYHGVIPADELELCGMNALWRALQYHREGYGQKFTTSLHMFTDWECKGELRRYRRQRKEYSLFDQHTNLYTVIQDRESDDLDYVLECLELLPNEWMKKVIQQYFFDGMTLEAIGRANGYGKEAARQKIKRALTHLRKICHA